MKNKRLLVILIVSMLAVIMSSCIEEVTELVFVTGITVVSQGNQETVLIGNTLQMMAQIQPNNATNKAVIWSEENAAGSFERENRAEITQEGVLTGLSAGDVVVKATAKDGSGVEGMKTITVTELDPETYTLTIEASPTEGGNVSGEGEYEQGEEVEMTATANEGYCFVNWTKDGIVISVQATYEYTMPAENVTMVANFEEEQPIAFACPVLEQAVRDANGYTGEPTGPIYPSDVLGIIEIYHQGETSLRDAGMAPRAKITSLEGIQYLTNLLRLFINYNNVSDISPLENLINLQKLYFQSNNVSDLSPLENLINLEWLHFDTNGASDITTLANLTKLRSLSFRYNNVSDIIPLMNLTNLDYLNFNSNNVSDLTPLVNLTNLGTLHFSYNNVSDIIPLMNLINLKVLYFIRNSVTDINPLVNLINLKWLNFDNNNVSVLTPLVNLTNIEVLRFNNNNVSDLSSLENLTNLKKLYFNHNSVSNIQPLVNNTGLDEGDEVDMRYNNLDLTPGSQNMNDINTLIGRGVNVVYEPQN